MAYATDIQGARIGVADRFNAFVSDWKEARAERAVYRNTVKELQALSDRELADLGIARSSIRFVASMAVQEN